MVDTVLQRCGWANSTIQYQQYHDQEWGVPVHDDRALFEFLILEGAQAGLSWSGFDPEIVSKYDAVKILELLANPGIVRNRLKIASAVSNAQAFLKVQEEFGSFDAYVWRFVGGRPKQNAWRSLDEIPASTPESDALSKDLMKRGFRFVGTTICYAFMQAVGMVNDHLVDCFRYEQLKGV
jgi:DNA-3-methyladenine glycosylase I